MFHKPQFLLKAEELINIVIVGQCRIWGWKSFEMSHANGYSEKSRIDIAFLYYHLGVGLYLVTAIWFALTTCL